MLVEPALVRVGNDAGVHQRRGGIAIFVAEVGADHLLSLVADAAQRQVKHDADFLETLEEHLAGLPVALFEIMHHGLELAAKFAIIEFQDCVDQPLRPAVIGGALPGKVERPDDDPGRIRLEPKRMKLGLDHDPLGGGDGPRFCGAGFVLSRPFASTEDLPHC